MKPDTCPKCGAATDTDALRFVHERYHNNESANWCIRHGCLPVIAELMQSYADWCAARRDGSGEDLRAAERAATEGFETGKERE